MIGINAQSDRGRKYYISHFIPGKYIIFFCLCICLGAGFAVVFNESRKNDW